MVPQEVMLALRPPKLDYDVAVSQMLGDYLREQASASKTDHELVGVMRAAFPGTRFSGVSYDFAVDFVARLRVQARNGPGTIRAKVGCLGRVWDWFLATNKLRELANPWRILPAGYSIATTAEQKQLTEAGKTVKRDQERNRRLRDGEQDNIERVLAGELLIDAERPLKPTAELGMMFRAIVDTGMRLRECYVLTRSRVVFGKENYLDLEGTKGDRGAVKPRRVPLRPRLRKLFAEWIANMEPGQERLFPESWNGSRSDKDLARTTAKLSAQFASLFRHAQCADFREHDLRHEATCRWVLLKGPDGHWIYRESEIIMMMGWKSNRMYLRYASLRGSDLSGRLDHLDAEESDY